jgi:exosortase N
MSKVLNISLPGRLSFRPYAFFIAMQVLIIVIALNGYLDFGSLNILLGAAALVFVLQNSHKTSFSNRFAWPTLIFLLLGFVMPVKTFLYASGISAILFLIETNYGKTGMLAVPTMALMSPVLQYLIDVFSFPIRLQLTSMAAALLNAAGVTTLANGNVIMQEGNEFSVDPGCMGLSMMQASLLLGIMLIAYYESKNMRRVRVWQMLLFFACIVLLNIIANLFRIVLLVHFRIMPETFAHHLVGLLCLLIYVFAPGVWLAKWFVTRAGFLNATMIGYKPGLRRTNLTHGILLLGTALLAVCVSRTDTYKKVDLNKIRQVNGFKASLPAPGIVKLENSHSLIYVKYIRGFYDMDHNPMICWKGSGYEFHKVEQISMNGWPVYTGLLTNNKDALYSAWWYTDGNTITTSQLQWRWDMLRTRNIYALVNVTSATKRGLEEEIKKIMNEKMLSSLFTKSVYH